MDNRLDIVFRFRPSANSPDGLLLSYLKNLGVTPLSNEMVLKALRAFWLPDTYESCGSKRGKELKRLARDTIFCLEEHANYLRNHFGIERPQPMSYWNPVAVQEQTLANDNPDPDPDPDPDPGDGDDEAWDSRRLLHAGGL
jgi:hypothetical protein